MGGYDTTIEQHGKRPIFFLHGASVGFFSLLCRRSTTAEAIEMLKERFSGVSIFESAMQAFLRLRPPTLRVVFVREKGE